MGYPGDESVEKRKRMQRSLIVSIIFSIIIHISVACGASPQAHIPTALAAPRVDCANPAPPNNGTSAPPAPATPGIVLINEALTSPHAQWTCTMFNNGVYNQEDAWIEIYNPQNQPLDLYSARTSIDQGPGTQQYIVPFGSIIEAHGFLALFPFTNSSPISQIRLTISQVVIDQVSIPSLADDTSYARIPDGSANWQITTMPTIASSNILSNTTAKIKATKTAETTKATSTPKQTTTRKSTNTQSTGISNDGTSADTSNTGIQPTWSALHLPSPEPNNAVTDNTTLHSSSPSSTSSAAPSDFPALLNKILLTLLVVTFIFALLWCWRLYRRHKGIGP